MKPFNHVPCPICGETRCSVAYRKKDLRFLCSDYEFTIVRCRGCGAGYVLDPPDEKTLHDYYPPSFYEANHASSGKTDVLGKKLALLETRLPARPGQERSLLDVGCAGGEFVRFARSRGWNAKGYEWSPTPQSAGEHIIQANRLEGCFPDASFDAVTAWAVMEHVFALHPLMAAVSRALKPRGLFVALATNFNSIPGRVLMQDDIPRHLTLFTRDSMTRLLKRHDLFPVAWTHADDIFSGTHRGLLVFLLKWLAGEKWGEILAQHRSPGRRREFCAMLKGKPSRITEAVCAFDRTLFAPFLDKLANRTRFGFTMTVIAQKRG